MHRPWSFVIWVPFLCLYSLKACEIHANLHFLYQFHLIFFTGFQHGGDVHACDHSGQTALHWAAVRGSIQVAELLLQNGAQIECADSHGYRVGMMECHFVL